VSSHFVRMFLTISLIVAVFNQRSCLAVPATKIKGWKILQTHAMQKRTSLYVTSRAVRIDNLDATWSIVAQAPDWDAVVYSRADRTFCKVPYLKWSKIGFPSFFVAEDVVSVPKNISSEAGVFNLAGKESLPVKILHWEGKAPTIATMMFRSKTAPALCRFTLVTTSAVDAPKEVKQMLEQYFRLPQTDGIVIKLSNSSERRPMLDTSLLKPVDFFSNVFLLPDGYKQVKSESEVWVNANDKKKINDFGELIGK